MRAFLRINTWDGVDWFHGESWEELLAWMDRLERILTPPEQRARRPVELSVLERRLLDAAEASGYRVDRLREAVADGTATTAASTGAGGPRLPNATGLPPGPTAAGSPIPSSDKPATDTPKRTKTKGTRE